MCIFYCDWVIFHNDSWHEKCYAENRPWIDLNRFFNGLTVDLDQSNMLNIHIMSNAKDSKQTVRELNRYASLLTLNNPYIRIIQSIWNRVCRTLTTTKTVCYQLTIAANTINLTAILWIHIKNLLHSQLFFFIYVLAT